MTGNKNLSLLYPKEEISQKIIEIANHISEDYQNREILIVCVLKGAFIFLADLVRNLQIPLTIEFVRLSSYGAQSQSSGNVTVTNNIELFIEGKDIIVVEDIVDSGTTLSYIVEKLSEKNPNSLKTCVLLDKRERRKFAIEADYVGFRLEKGFVVGYGLDFNEKYRHLPEIYRLIDDSK